MKKHVHLTQITYLRYLVKMKHHISYFYNALYCIKVGVKHKVHQVRIKQIDSHKGNAWT